MRVSQSRWNHSWQCCHQHISIMYSQDHIPHQMHLPADLAHNFPYPPKLELNQEGDSELEMSCKLDGESAEERVKGEAEIERSPRLIPDSEPTQAKSEEISSTLDNRHNSNYDEMPYEQSTITARESDIEANEIEIDEIISITEDQTDPNDTDNPYREHPFPERSALQYVPVLLPERGRRCARILGKKSKKNRKIRTTITKEKLAEMNRIFAEYTAQKEEGKNPQFNLKQIGQQLQLGYSTILHKFREFRATKKVRGGALIASLQKKRKYRKSVEIQQIIQKALTERPFYTAVELSKYILCKFQRSFSRSIISRHLGEMGYSYKNLKSTPIEKNKPKYKEIRRMFAELMLPILADPRAAKTVIYVDEMACSLSSFIKRKGTDFKRSQPKEAEEYVYVLIAARNDEMVYYEVKEGFPSRRDFCRALGGIRTKMNQLLKYEAGGEQWPLVVVCDLNRIHRDGQGEGECIRETLNALNMRQYFLPPFSFQLNPIETIFLNIKNRINKQIHTIQELHMSILQYMRLLQNDNVDVHFKDIPDWLQKSLREENF